MRSTHTYVTLPVSAVAHAEVTRKLKAAGYDHVFDGDEINMHGLALIHDTVEPEVSQEMIDAWKVAFHDAYAGGKGEGSYDDHIKAGLIAALSTRVNHG